MTTSQYLLNLGLLAYILASNLGTHPVTRRRFTLPLVLVAVAAAAFLRTVPTLGHDLALELVGTGAGIALGILAGLLVRVRREDGRLLMSAGASYAALWVVVIGGRVLFAYGAEHWFARSIGEFSMRHQITGADAWTCAFVLMALSMVLARVAVTAARAGLTLRRRTVPVAA
jgi:hypothetical protein